jgi:hypothetical protein
MPMTLQEFRALSDEEKEYWIADTPLTDLVANGVAWLDETVPGWRTKPATWKGFSIKSHCNCVCGKLSLALWPEDEAGDEDDWQAYMQFARRYGLGPHDRMFLGFTLGQSLSRCWHELNDAWLNVLPKEALADPE